MKTRKAYFGSRGRRAHTLTELLIATALAVVILSQVGMALISCLRLFEATVANMELSLRSRSLREKLLYRINTDGGLMSACQTGLSLVNGVAGTGKSITFKPVSGQQNTLTLGATKQLVANLNLNNNWLVSGTMVFQGTNVFTLSATTGTVDTVNVNLAMSIAIATRTYMQTNLVEVQIMNNK